MKLRRRARVLALQALFEINSVGHDPETVLRQRLEDTPLPPGGSDFARHLVWGVLEHRSQLDRIIQKHAPEWPVEQMALIDRNILRIAIFEMVIDRRTPVKVAINDAVEVAKLFGSESSRRFVNGVLGAVAAQHPELHHPRRPPDETEERGSF